jgi:hypothetical protein
MSRFAKLPHDFLHHPTFRSAGGNAKCVLLELWSRHNGKNNGDLSLSYREAKTLLGLGQAAYSAALNEQQERRLIVNTSPGQFVGRFAATWRLTMIADKGAQPNSDYLAWKPRKPCIGNRYASYGKPVRKAANDTGTRYANGHSLVRETLTPLDI